MIRAAATVAVAVAVAVVLGACSPGDDTDSDVPAADDADSVGLRAVAPVDDGNAYTAGRAALTTADPVVTVLAVDPLRLVPVDGPGAGFVVVGADGSVVGVGTDVVGSPVVDPAGPAPGALATAEGAEMVTWDLPDLGGAVPLPDGVPTVSSQGDLAVLADATDRYPHGILGDRFEASALVVVAGDGTATTITPPAATMVFEDLRPTWADVDGDGDAEVLVTVSGGGTGARVVAYAPSGEVVAATPVIATPDRWRHRIAVAPLGPSAEPTYVEVITPHIGGDLTLRVADADGLTRTSRAAPYASHFIFSRDLDGAHVLDADGDGEAEVVVPDASRSALVVFDVGADGLTESTRVPLDGELATGIAVAVRADGVLDVAVATTDGRVLVWAGG